ncbi:ATP-grasp domain-containing protein [Amphibacillus sediminis]|uniref:ATP-grasp domain-containing protein n=1 Tax=Amphibacillus sediminis TaxID=360185 RepID=UPI0008378F0E|nr:RimK family alpha-L-glutamate ligase [Amphibacillus sediminis]
MYKGWLIYNGGLLDQKFLELNEWYIQTAAYFDIHLTAVANSDLVFGIKENKPAIMSPIQNPDFVLYLDKDIRLAEQIQLAGIPVFNSAQTIAWCDNKIMMHQRLAKYGLPQPETIFAPMLFPDQVELDINYLDQIIEQLSLPLIVKEAFGSFGEQVYLVKNKQELIKTAKALRFTPHLYQAYIKSSHGKDIRIHVVGDQVVASMKRISLCDFRANVSNGATMEEAEPDASFKALAVKASQAVGADFSGVDLLFAANGNPIICEVNSNAHIKNIFNCTGIDVSEAIFEHIIHMLNRIHE